MINMDKLLVIDDEADVATPSSASLTCPIWRCRWPPAVKRAATAERIPPKCHHHGYSDGGMSGLQTLGPFANSTPKPPSS